MHVESFCASCISIWSTPLQGEHVWLWQSLADLRTDTLDLVLLHYPRCWDGLCGDDQPEGTWSDSWRALEDAVLAGSVRTIGEANMEHICLPDRATIMRTTNADGGMPHRRLKFRC